MQSQQLQNSPDKGEIRRQVVRESKRVFRGVCGECNTSVFSDQYREFHHETYFHRECYARRTANVLLAVVQPKVQEVPENCQGRKQRDDDKKNATSVKEQEGSSHPKVLQQEVSVKPEDIPQLKITASARSASIKASALNEATGEAPLGVLSNSDLATLGEMDAEVPPNFRVALEESQLQVVLLERQQQRYKQQVQNLQDQVVQEQLVRMTLEAHLERMKREKDTALQISEQRLETIAQELEDIVTERDEAVKASETAQLQLESMSGTMRELRAERDGALSAGNIAKEKLRHAAQQQVARETSRMRHAVVMVQELCSDVRQVRNELEVNRAELDNLPESMIGLKRQVQAGLAAQQQVARENSRMQQAVVMVHELCSDLCQVRNELEVNRAELDNLPESMMARLQAEVKLLSSAEMAIQRMEELTLLEPQLARRTEQLAMIELHFAHLMQHQDNCLQHVQDSLTEVESELGHPVSTPAPIHHASLQDCEQNTLEFESTQTNTGLQTTETLCAVRKPQNRPFQGIFTEQQTQTETQSQIAYDSKHNPTIAEAQKRDMSTQVVDKRIEILIRRLRKSKDTENLPAFPWELEGKTSEFRDSSHSIKEMAPRITMKSPLSPRTSANEPGDLVPLFRCLPGTKFGTHLDLLEESAHGLEQVILGLKNRVSQLDSNHWKQTTSSEQLTDLESAKRDLESARRSWQLLEERLVEECGENLVGKLSLQLQQQAIEDSTKDKQTEAAEALKLCNLWQQQLSAQQLQNLTLYEELLKALRRATVAERTLAMQKQTHKKHEVTPAYRAAAVEVFRAMPLRLCGDPGVENIASDSAGIGIVSRRSGFFDTISSENKFARSACVPANKGTTESEATENFANTLVAIHQELVEIHKTITGQMDYVYNLEQSEHDKSILHQELNRAHEESNELRRELAEARETSEVLRSTTCDLTSEIASAKEELAMMHRWQEKWGACIEHIKSVLEQTDVSYVILRQEHNAATQNSRDVHNVLRQMCFVMEELEKSCIAVQGDLSQSLCILARILEEANVEGRSLKRSNEALLAAIASLQEQVSANKTQIEVQAKMAQSGDDSQRRAEEQVQNLNKEVALLQKRLKMAEEYPFKYEEAMAEKRVLMRRLEAAQHSALEVPQWKRRAFEAQRRQQQIEGLYLGLRDEWNALKRSSRASTSQLKRLCEIASLPLSKGQPVEILSTQSSKTTPVAAVSTPRFRRTRLPVPTLENSLSTHLSIEEGEERDRRPFESTSTQDGTKEKPGHAESDVERMQVQPQRETTKRLPNANATLIPGGEIETADFLQQHGLDQEVPNPPTADPVPAEEESLPLPLLTASHTLMPERGKEPTTNKSELEAGNKTPQLQEETDEGGAGTSGSWLPSRNFDFGGLSSSLPAVPNLHVPTPSFDLGAVSALSLKNLTSVPTLKISLPSVVSMPWASSSAAVEDASKTRDHLQEQDGTQQPDAIAADHDQAPEQPKTQVDVPKKQMQSGQPQVSGRNRNNAAAAALSMASGAACQDAAHLDLPSLQGLV